MTKTLLLFMQFIFLFAFSQISKGNTLSDTSGYGLLEPFEENSIMIKDTKNDDLSLEINISMRYFFRKEDSEEKADLGGYYPFFSYTMRSDFFWFGKDTRTSGPVISRYQNPALHFRNYFTTGNINNECIRKNNCDWFDVGFEHISNGQTKDASSDRLDIQNALSQDKFEVLDGISRVAAGIALTFEMNKILTVDDDELYKCMFSLKVFALRAGQEADVYWGPEANKGYDYNDYQLARIQGYYVFNRINSDKKYPQPMQLKVEGNIGKQGFDTDSWNITLNYPIKISDSSVFPLAISYHYGPFSNLSDYTIPRNHFKVGASFSF